MRRWSQRQGRRRGVPSRELQLVEFTLSSAQIKALGSYVILASPGTNSMWQVTQALVGLIAGSDAVADPLVADASLFLMAGSNSVVAVFTAAELGSTASKQKTTAVSMPIDTLAHLENQALKLAYGGTAITGNAAADARLFCSVTYREVPL